MRRFSLAAIGLLLAFATPALAQEQDLPRFRRTSTFTSYVEGWGLYAERLAKDLGWYENDPYGYQYYPDNFLHSQTQRCLSYS